MPGTTSTALPSFSHDQHHETDAAKWKGGACLKKKKQTPMILQNNLNITNQLLMVFGREDHYPPIVGEKFDMASCIIYIETVAPLQTTGKCQRIK